MNCPKCKAASQVLRTERMAGGARRRSRQCNAPSCGLRFVTLESVRQAGAPEAIDTVGLEASLRDGRGYDRDAIAAALRTDRRRAAITRRQAQERAAELEAGYDDEREPLDRDAARRILRGY